jgi:bifunctional non-homologous end joining protein LigD
MLASVATAIPIGPRWSYEVKWDGYRTMTVLDRGRATLYSRNLKDATRQYAPIVRAVESISATTLILDGELVTVDEHGHPSFQALHHQAAHTLAFYVFDVLHLNGRDLMTTPLKDRRMVLTGLTLPFPVLRSDPLPGTPAQIESAIRGLGLDGLVAKRIDSKYEPGKRSGAWTKVKFQQRQEFVIGGFTEDRDWVDALVVGYYEGRKLLAAGKVRAGLTPPLRPELRALPGSLRTKTCPFANLPDSRSSHWGEGITAEEMDTIVWLKPKMVAEIAFTEWTRDHQLRHAAFVGLRWDRPPRTVIRETS